MVWLTSAILTARMAIARRQPAWVAGARFFLANVICYWLSCYDFSIFGRAVRMSARVIAKFTELIGSNEKFWLKRRN